MKPASETSKGTFVISLDFELYWGLLDVCPATDIDEDLIGTKSAVDGMLRLFEKYEVHATWATVGLLFADSQEEAQQYSPSIKSEYSDKKMDPYHYLRTNSILRKEYHFAPDMIEQIRNTENQEIASHTFSHFYCLEESSTPETFRADIKAAKAIAKNKGIDLKSLVFPRNQWNPEYLAILKEEGITSYRGNEESQIYKASKGVTSVARRIVHHLDSILNISGFNTYSLKKNNSSDVLNIPSSRQLKSHNWWLSFLDGAKKKRIFDAMEHAAKNGEVFHLWWHPEDFGRRTVPRLKFLQEILEGYKILQEKYGMQSLNMQEITR